MGSSLEFWEKDGLEIFHDLLEKTQGHESISILLLCF